MTSTRLEPDQVSRLLDEDGWVRSVGLGAGRHYRREREHLRVMPAGHGWLHEDYSDPYSDPAGHLLFDAMPELARSAGKYLGRAIFGRRRHDPE